MSTRPKVTLKNVLSFFEGNAKHYMFKIFGRPAYLQEQFLYRINLCKDDCIPNNGCKYCGCPPEKKALVNKSCNNGKRFPDLMSKEDWEKFKEKNGI